MYKVVFPVFILVIFFSSCSRPDRYTVAGDHVQMEKKQSVSLENRPKIVVDAGHGGKDAGAACKTGAKVEEKALTLATAQMLSQKLQKMGYQTILTRGDDIFVPLNLRAAFANGNRAALFISVHYNSAANAKAEGVEVYYYDKKDDSGRSEMSKKLAATVLDAIVANTGSKSRGVKPGDFAVIRETKMPAILVEGGFVSNEGEMNRLRESQYLDTIAQSIAQGVKSYLGSP